MSPPAILSEFLCSWNWTWSSQQFCCFMREN